MKKKGLLLIAMTVVLATVVNLFAGIVAFAAGDSTNEPELVYTVDFRGNDGKFAPTPILDPETNTFAADNFDYTPSADGSALTVKGKSTGTNKTSNYWGASITGLTADETTLYTMIYKVKANGNKGKDNSIGIGGWIVDGDAAGASFYNNYSNHNTTNDDGSVNEDRRAALSHKKAKYNGDYVKLSTLEAYEEDAEGFITMKLVFDGANQKFYSYILADNKTGSNAADWLQIEEQPMDKANTDTADTFGFMIYAHYNVIDTTVKDVKIYKSVATVEGEKPALSTGTGTEADPYQISTKEDLLAVAALYNAGTAMKDLHFKMTADIDLGGMAWTPIGSVVNDDQDGAFTGVFDGNGKTVSNFTVTAADASGNTRYGFFGGMAGGTIKNLKIANATFTSTGAGTGSIAAVLGRIYSGTVSGCETAADVTVSITAAGGNSRSGGIVGYGLGTITYCVNRATVTSSVTDKTYFNGGIIGGFTNGTLSYCVNLGTVACTADGATSYVAGICGQLDNWSSTSATIESCINYGKIESKGATDDYAGGIVGHCKGAKVRIMNNNYNFGSVTANDESAGQIIAFVATAIAMDSVGNYAASNIKDAAPLCGNTEAFDGTTLMTTATVAEMQDQANYKAIVQAMNTGNMFGFVEPTVEVVQTPGDSGNTGDTGDTGDTGSDDGSDDGSDNSDNSNGADNSTNETTPVTNEPTTTPTDEKKSGCKSSVGMASFSILAVLGAAVVCKKKKF